MAASMITWSSLGFRDASCLRKILRAQSLHSTFEGGNYQSAAPSALRFESFAFADAAWGKSTVSQVGTEVAMQDPILSTISPSYNTAESETQTDASCKKTAAATKTPNALQ